MNLSLEYMEQNQLNNPNGIDVYILQIHMNILISNMNMLMIFIIQSSIQMIIVIVLVIYKLVSHPKNNDAKLLTTWQLFVE